MFASFGARMTSDMTRMDAGDDDAPALLNKSDLVRAQRLKFLRSQNVAEH
jgi:hypothetical protein